MKELISKRIDDLLNPEIPAIYDIVFNGKDSVTHKEFMSQVANTLQNEFLIKECIIKTTIIHEYKILIFHFLIIELDGHMFGKFVMYSNNLHKTTAIDLLPNDEFNRLLSKFISDFKTENRQIKIKNILN